MKYLIGFIVGVLVTAMFFTYQLKKRNALAAPSATTAEKIPEESETNGGLPKDFLSFYQHFHNDSLYQLEHVLFPLQGIPSKADSMTLVNQNFRWQKEDWILHQPFENFGGDYSRSYEQLNKGLIVETIRMMKAPFGMQRRFSKSGDDWYLIYYAGMNRLKVEE